MPYFVLPTGLIQMRIKKLEWFKTFHGDINELHSEVVEFKINETEEDRLQDWNVHLWDPQLHHIPHDLESPGESMEYAV